MTIVKQLYYMMAQTPLASHRYGYVMVDIQTFSKQTYDSVYNTLCDLYAYV